MFIIQFFNQCLKNLSLEIKISSKGFVQRIQEFTKGCVRSLNLIRKKKRKKKRKIYVEFISRSYVFSINFDTRNRFFYQCRSLRYGIHTNESCKLIRRPYRIRTHIRRTNFVKNASTFSIVRIRTVQLLV